jgi:hypothetical protein
MSLPNQSDSYTGIAVKLSQADWQLIAEFIDTFGDLAKHGWYLDQLSLVIRDQAELAMPQEQR